MINKLNKRGMVMRRADRSFILILIVAPLVGCDGTKGSLEFPDLNPSDAAAQAMELYDISQDDYLDREESKECPAFQKAFRRIDQNDDGLISTEEIENRISKWLKSGTVIVDVVAEVTLDGNPLSNAEIVVEPESFLGEDYSSLRSSTDAAGMATFSDARQQVPGLHVGFYRVRISQKGSDGQEKLPKQYNLQTQLGFEVAENVGNHSRFELMSTP